MTPRTKLLLWLAPLTLGLFLPSARLSATVYYINKGVHYHIGNGHFAHSTDAMYVGCYPVVGLQWIQAFRVTQDDMVKVRIEHIWGVDDCPYCKDMISINDHLMGRLFAVNNHQPFDSPKELTCPVEKGKTYYLKIESYSSIADQADDFVFSDVVVESDHPDVVFMQPGPVIKMPDQPMPPVFEPAPTAPVPDCDHLIPERNWMLGWDGGKPRSENLSAAQGFADSGNLASLEPGHSLDLSFSIGSQALNADRVDYSVEVLAGPKADSGWVFQFHDQVPGLYHGNMKVKGRYTASSFQAADLRRNGPNQVRVEYCPDGTLRLRLNGSDLGQALDGLQGPQMISVRALGVPVVLGGGQ